MAKGKALGSAVRKPSGKAFGMRSAASRPGFDTAAYDQLNVEKAQEFIRSSSNKAEIFAYERKNKNRSGVLALEHEGSE